MMFDELKSTMTNASKFSHGPLLLGFVLILFIGNAVKGRHCSSYEPLEAQDLQNGNCQQLVYGTHNRYHTMECTVSRYHYFSETHKCISKWCYHIASCLNQTSEWEALCSKTFYKFRLSQFDISTSAAEAVNVSYVRNIHVMYCSREDIDWKTLRLRFAMKTTGYRCESENAQNGNPCLGQWIGSLSSSDKCDKLVNGTNGSWLKVSSAYYKQEWCRLLETCFQSQKLKERCLTDFEFYYRYFKYSWNNPKFTIEIGTYLSGTRILVTYDLCFYQYLFAVNIIRCNSFVNSSGSEVESGNGDDDDDCDLNQEMINAINELDIQKNDSLQDAVRVFEAKMKEYVNHTSIPGNKRLNKTTEQEMEDVFMATVTFEEFALRFGQYHLIDKAASSIHLTSENVDLQVRRRFYENESDFHLVEPQGQNYIRIPSEDFSNNGSLLLGVLYKDLHQLFLTNKTNTNPVNDTRRSLNTIIMSATVYPRPATLQKNVTLMFSNVIMDAMAKFGLGKLGQNREWFMLQFAGNAQGATGKRKCVFWNFLENSPVGWSGQGCDVKWMNDSKTVCSCNHLTHFAVLMQFGTNPAGGKNNIRISEKDEKILNILTYLGLTLSLIGITLTILCYSFLTDMKAPLSQIRISLVASLGAGQIIFLAGIGATENKGVCVTVAATVQYFFMAAFCWMLIEGIYLYLFVVKVYNVSSKMKICHGVSWVFFAITGTPALLVVLSLSTAAGMDGIESFVSDEYCWMSSSNSLIWIFVSFVIAIELLNVLILVRVIKEMTAMEQAKDNHAEQIRLGIKACLVLIPLLGVTWLFGALSSTHKAFVYIFVIFNSTQGFFIFILHCVRNSEIRERFKRRIRVIFPASSDATSAVKRNSELNDSSGIISLRKIEVRPKSTDSLVKTAA